MDRRLARQAHRAHVQEVRAERKETRLHAQAARAAVHGNIGKAVIKEIRASKQASAADNARARQLAATNAIVAHHCIGAGCQCCHHGNRLPHHHHGNRQHMLPLGQVTVHTPQPPCATTVTQTTYAGPPLPYAPYPAYPTGTVPPPGPTW